MPMRVNVNLNIPVNNMNELRTALNVLSSYDVLVGVPSDDERRDASGRTARTKGTINNAALAYIHNNGSPSQNIPARPTLQPGIEDAKTSIVKQFEDGGRAALDGHADRVERNLSAAGQAAVDAVKLRIRSNTPPPLKAATLAARRHRGVTRTNTLVDTTQYLNSHTFIVRKGDS